MEPLQPLQPQVGHSNALPVRQPSINKAVLYAMMLPCAILYYHLPLRAQHIVGDEPMIAMLPTYILLLELSLLYQLFSAMRLFTSTTDSIEAFLERKVLGSLARIMLGVYLYVLGAFSFHFSAIIMYLTKFSLILGLDYHFGAVEHLFRIGAPAALMYAACRIFLVGVLRLLRILPGRKRDVNENVTWVYLLSRPAVVALVLLLVLEVFMVVLIMIVAVLIADSEDEFGSAIAKEMLGEL